MSAAIKYGAYPYRVTIGPKATAEEVDAMFDFLEEQGLRLTTSFQEALGTITILAEEGDPRG